jgi:hypothetical protein
MPPTYQPPPAYQPAPYPAAWGPGQSAAVASAGAGGFLSQFGGAAAWSIGCGLVAIIVPLVSTFYFPVRSRRPERLAAIVRGRMLGGLVGSGSNIIAYFMSLAFSACSRAVTE